MGALRVFIFILVGMASVALSAADKLPPLRLSLKAAIAMAQRESVDVITANDRVHQAIARLGQARSTLLPQLNGAVSEQRRTVNLEAQGIVIPGQPFVVGPFNTFDARISLTQTIFDMAAISRLNAAQQGISISQEQARKTRQDTMALVGTFYIEAKRAQDAMLLARALMKRDTENYHVVRAQLQIGNGSEVAVKQAEAQLADSRNKLEKTVAESVERRLDLAAALGIPNHQPIDFVGETGLRDTTLPGDGEVTAASQDHPDVAIASTTMKQRKTDKATELSGYLPRLTGNADVGQNGQQVTGTQMTYTLGVQLSVPIFDSGLKAKRYQEAASRLEESRSSLKDVAQHVEAKVLSARESLKQTRTQLEAAKFQLSYATKDRALAQERFNIGTGTALDLVRSQANEAFARDGQYEAVATHQMAQINLAHAMGHMESLAERDVY